MLKQFLKAIAHFLRQVSEDDPAVVTWWKGLDLTFGVLEEPSSVISMVLPGISSILSGRSLNTGDAGWGLWEEFLPLELPTTGR